MSRYLFSSCRPGHRCGISYSSDKGDPVSGDANKSGLPGQRERGLSERSCDNRGQTQTHCDSRRPAPHVTFGRVQKIWVAVLSCTISNQLLAQTNPAQQPTTTPAPSAPSTTTTQSPYAAGFQSLIQGAQDNAPDPSQTSTQEGLTRGGPPVPMPGTTLPAIQNGSQNYGRGAAQGGTATGSVSQAPAIIDASAVPSDTGSATDNQSSDNQGVAAIVSGIDNPIENGSGPIIRPTTNAVAPAQLVPTNGTTSAGTTGISVAPIYQNYVVKPGDRGSTVIAVPSTQVARPSSLMTAPSNQVQVPSGMIAMPSNQITMPGSQITVPSNQITMLGSQITVPSTQVRTPGSAMTSPDLQPALCGR